MTRDEEELYKKVTDVSETKESIEDMQRDILKTQREILRTQKQYLNDYQRRLQRHYRKRRNNDAALWTVFILTIAIVIIGIIAGMS